MVGSISPNAEINMACCWLLLTVDIMIPSESAREINRMVSPNKQNDISANRQFKYKITQEQDDHCIDTGKKDIGSYLSGNNLEGFQGRNQDGFHGTGFLFTGNGN